jgi:hypothetical protein
MLGDSSDRHTNARQRAGGVSVNECCPIRGEGTVNVGTRTMVLTFGQLTRRP